MCCGFARTRRVLLLAVLLLSGCERMFSVPQVEPVDFSRLPETGRTNQYLVCPPALCAGDPHEASPVYAVGVAELRRTFEEVMAGEPRLQVLREDPALRQVDYVQRSAVFRFPDLVTVRFIDVEAGRASLAIYSRSVYGRSDLGVNRKRVRRWLETLHRRLPLAKPAR